MSPSDIEQTLYHRVDLTQARQFQPILFSVHLCSYCQVGMLEYLHHKLWLPHLSVKKIKVRSEWVQFWNLFKLTIYSDVFLAMFLILMLLSQRHLKDSYHLLTKQYDSYVTSCDRKYCVIYLNWVITVLFRNLSQYLAINVYYKIINGLKSQKIDEWIVLYWCFGKQFSNRIR